ncbi:hypothetical protein BD410DRAFT_782993 [Rickenella mellea]|uniref:Uncharacterized protein n=1 Tax=Rickenella mellea TaxID=50990 RepID=A0A4Y7QHI9_9AGAM|nr:hypothetical protein BD410DRAFT_782993 [Rickenella mellea]
MPTFVEDWTDQYGQKSDVAGMHYLAVALGSTVGGQVGARVLNTKNEGKEWRNRNS